MGKIFGVAGWGKGTTKAVEILDSLSSVIPGQDQGTDNLETTSSGDIGLGFTSLGRSFSGGVASREGVFLVSWVGFMPGLDDLFRSEGLSLKAGQGENLFSLYKEHGPDFLKSIPGMFSITMYDVVNRRLLLVSDRNGAFPVYYSTVPEGLLFSSSLKDVRRVSGLGQPDPFAMTQHLFFHAVYDRRTCYQGIEMLGNGEYLVRDCVEGSIEYGSYYRYEELFDHDQYMENRRADAPSQLHSRMRSALGSIMSNVDPERTGLSCGGGIDCSYLGAVLKELGFELPVFCTNVSHGGVDERAMAEGTSGRLGVDLRISDLSRDEFYRLLIRMISDYDQPVVHPNGAKLYVTAEMASRFNRSNQIMGAASDLLFGGFHNVVSYYRYIRMRKFLGFLPPKIRSILATCFRDPKEEDIRLRLRNSLPEIGSVGFGDIERARVQQRIKDKLSVIEDNTERKMKTLMLENLCDYQRHLLNRRNEYSSLHGVSLYYPFLDGEIVKFAVNLPASYCADWNNSKIIVREVSKRVLGKNIARRAKWGGGIPLREWIFPLTPLLSDGFISRYTGTDVSSIKDTLDKDAGMLWTLIDIELWGRICVLNEDPEGILANIDLK